MSEAYRKARERYLHFKQQIADRLEKERPADKRDLMHVKTRSVLLYNSLNIRYPSYPMWCFRFDDLMKLPLTVSINSFRFQRNKHEQDVKDLLISIAIRKSGTALFDEMEDTGKDLYIEPYWSFGKTAYKNDNALFGSLGINATAEEDGDADENGQSDAKVSFTPSMWGPATFDPKTNLSTGTSGKTGPGAGADDVLFHEMVHASRYMRGVSDSDETVDKGYQNKEEFLAVVVANIYMAEKKKRAIRESHHGFHRLPHPEAFLDNTQNISPTPRKLFAEFRSEQRKFFRHLAGITEHDAWWNPVRTYEDEIAAARPHKAAHAPAHGHGRHAR